MDPSLVSCSDESSVSVTYSSSATDSSEVSKLSCPSSFFWGKLQYNGCQGYFECINGLPQDDSLTICEEGTLYNEMSSQCADSSSVSCSQEPHIFPEPEEMKEDYTTPQFSGPVKGPDGTLEDYTIQQFTSPFKGSEVVNIDTENNLIPITESPTHYLTLSPTPYPTSSAPTKRPEQVQNPEPTLHPTNRPTRRPTERPVEARTKKPSSPVASSFASMADSFMLFSSSSSSSKDKVTTEKPTAAVYIPPKKGQESLSQMLEGLTENPLTKFNKKHGGKMKMNKKKKQKSKGEEPLEQDDKKDKDKDKNKSSKSNKVKMNKVKKKKQDKPTKVKMNKVKKKKQKKDRQN